MENTNFTLGELCEDHRIPDNAPVKIGDNVKVTFLLNEPVMTPSGKEAGSESMWVCVTDINGGQYTGYLSNDPVCVTGIAYEDTLTFTRASIKDVLPSDATH